MKVTILNTMVPFLYGGAEFLAEDLQKKLEEHGHEAQIIRLPFAWGSPSQVSDCMMAARLAALVGTDKVIALKFPTYYVHHVNKTVWLLHQFRQAYDFEGTPYDMFGADAESQGVKKAVIQSDNHFLSQSEGRLYTISPIVTERLMKYNGIPSEVLYPPLMNAKSYRCGEYGDYIFYPSRVNGAKRQHILVEAMALVKSGVRLVLAGKGDRPEDEEEIFKSIEKFKIQDKVTYLNRFISQEEKVELFANSLGCAFVPLNEDYGYVTLEAFYAKKPVITFTDSGCPAYFVNEGGAGIVTEPYPEMLAKAMDNLYMDKKKAEELGNEGIPTLERLGVNWDNVVEKLIR